MTILPGSASLPPTLPTRCSATIERFSRAMTIPWCAWSTAPLCPFAALVDMHPSRCRCRRSTALRPAYSPAGRNKRPRLRSRVKGRTARQPVLCRSISAMLKTAGPSMPGTPRARAWKISLTWCPPPWPAIYTPAIYRASGRASRRENVICRSSRCSTIMRISRA